MDRPPLLKIKDVTARTRRSKAAIYRDIRRGTFPSPRKVGTSSLWVAAEVEVWIESVIGGDRATGERVRRAGCSE